MVDMIGAVLQALISEELIGAEQAEKTRDLLAQGFRALYWSVPCKAREFTPRRRHTSAKEQGFWSGRAGHGAFGDAFWFFAFLEGKCHLSASLHFLPSLSSNTSNASLFFSSSASV